MKGNLLHNVTWEESPIWLRVLAVFAFTSFFTFFLSDVILGGSSLNGGARDGHFFLRSHAHIREGSRAVFFYSQIHGITAWSSMIVLMFAAVAFNCRRSS